MFRRSILVLLCSANMAYALPTGFVYLQTIDPSIQQEIRYAGSHNVIGRPLQGYQANTCILTKPAALALARVQTELKRSGLSLKVYDCYRPVQAVQDLVAWSQLFSRQEMKAEFYPRVDKTNLFAQGYFAMRSGHSRGSTLDLTIVPMRAARQISHSQTQALVACYAPYHQRYRDNSLDMGTGYDCLDEVANYHYMHIPAEAKHNRQLLRQLMSQNGFEGYDKEWWHFQLRDEPYSERSFHFPVR